MRGIVAPTEKGLDYWIIHNPYDYLRVLFAPRSEKAYSLNAIIHFFMHRLGQSYESVLNMPTDDREEIFNIEMQVIEQEKKNAEESKNKSKRKR